MSSINFNFGQDAAPADGSFEPLPVGIYRCIAEKVEEVMSSNHSPMLKTTLTIIEGPHQGRKFFENTVLTQAAQNFVLHYFQCFGFPVGPGQSININHADIVGRSVMVKVEGHHDYNGKKREDFSLMPDTGPSNQGEMAPRAPQGSQQNPPQMNQQQPQQPMQQNFTQQTPPQQQQQGFGNQGTIPINPQQQQQATQGGGQAPGKPPF